MIVAAFMSLLFNLSKHSSKLFLLIKFTDELFSNSIIQLNSSDACIDIGKVTKQNNVPILINFVPIFELHLFI